MSDDDEDLKKNNVVEFIPKDSFEHEFGKMAQKKGKLTSREFSRRQVVDAFQEAFETVGGVRRLAIWANDNPTEFYKLYARLLPSQSSKDLEDSKEVHIIHVLPKTSLDK
jgi:hypothetical protein